MEIVSGHQRVPGWPRAAVAIGNFDGVHLGHRALVERTLELAAKYDAKAIALTFDPHPSSVLATGPVMLSSLDRKLELLAELGLDAVVVEPFTRELASRLPQAFLDDIVVKALAAKAIVVGYDFTYGQARAGTTDELRAHGAREGIEVDVVSCVEVGGEVVSSTRVRGYLKAGQIEGANRLLGRAWDIDGVVVHGAKRGRTIGVPTANVEPFGDLPIPGGIYAVRLQTIGGEPMAAVASLGTNPTFVEAGKLVLEVHVLDWDGDLYDRSVRVSFVSWLRDELRFESVDALIAQIREDIVVARRVLAG